MSLCVLFVACLGSGSRRYSMVLRTFSYAPRKMKPPMLMKVTLGMLPANSLQRADTQSGSREHHGPSLTHLIKYCINYIDDRTARTLQVTGLK